MGNRVRSTLLQNIIPFLLIILSLPVVGNETENGRHKLEVYATYTTIKHKLEVYATIKRHFQLEMV